MDENSGFENIITKKNRGPAYMGVPFDDQQVMDSIATAVIVCDTKGTIKMFNKAAEQMFNFTKKEAIGVKYYYGLAPEEENRLQEVFNYVVRTGKTFCGQDISFYNNEKCEVIVNPHVSLIRDKSGLGVGVVMIVEDVTEKRALEKIIQRKEKLTALGELSVGIAHELRNPLSSIKGFAEIVRKNLNNDKENQRYLDIIINEVDRIRNISRELLDTAKDPNIDKYVALQINEVLKESVKNFKLENSNINACIKCNLKEGLPMILGDPDKLSMVINNLLYNAYQSLITKGDIGIESSAVSDWIIIKISDTGSGITQDRIDRIFDPFYTTKPNGSGLGLAIAHSIVSNHWGDIEVESKLGEGSIFTIKLPVKGEGGDY